jgi:murein L,D-transpeptidase YcbB/YkuD
MRKLSDMANVLAGKKSFKDFDDYPADAQLGLLSMSWALGTGLEQKWRIFSGACATQDWVTATAQSQFKQPIGTQRVRNACDWALFRDTAYVVRNGWDGDTLYYQLQGNHDTVRLGSTGPDVSALQVRLILLGYLATATDTFDEGTDAALRDFQQENNLTADGICGAVSWAALGTCVPKGGL